jgi:predicted transcriptional regulator
LNLTSGPPITACWKWQRGHEQTPRMMPLADLLISRPAVSAKTVAQCLGLTPHGARAMLLELEELALIREMSGRKSYRIFTATAF